MIKYRTFMDVSTERDMINLAVTAHIVMNNNVKIELLVSLLRKMEPYCIWTERPDYDYWYGYGCPR